MPHGNHGRLRSSGILYGNCEVYPPDSDIVMFRCNNDKMKWYLERNLAVLVRESPPIIRLTFTPKGPGHIGEPYFLQTFLNRCVVCGCEEELNHHHIVPDAYRRHFPRDAQGWWMYDVLLLCVPCHDHYEGFAYQLKETIAQEHGVPSSGITNLDVVRLRAMKAGAAIHRHGKKIPREKRMLLEADFQAYFGKEATSLEDYHEVWKDIRRSIKTTPAGEIVVATLKDVDAFAVKWRRHFVEVMKPKFLPSGWEPDRIIYSRKENL
jgi:hypothetical protein